MLISERRQRIVCVLRRQAQIDNVYKMKEQEPQITQTLLMIRPSNFGFNPQTAEDNAFQHNDGTLSEQAIRHAAIEEFDGLVANLRDKGIEVIVVEDTPEPVKSDAVFPNNWFTTHTSGCLYLYPMFAPLRRLERRMDVVERLAKDFEVRLREDYVSYEANDVFLEGTGSMVLDRPNKKVYACLSERTHQLLLEKWAHDNQYEAVYFRATDHDGTPYYHTNVIMALGRKVAVICVEAINNEKDRSAVIQSLETNDKLIIQISREQVLQFAGNMLEVDCGKDKGLMVMSQCAFESLTPSQILEIEKHCEILSAPIPVIEKYGGGSVRCMMAEIFLQKK